jgi:hypothetical protein
MKMSSDNIGFVDNNFRTWMTQWNGESLTPEKMNENRAAFESFYENMMDRLGIAPSDEWQQYIMQEVYWPTLQAEHGDRLSKLGITSPLDFMANGDEGSNGEGGEETPDVPRSEEPDLNEEDPEAITPPKKLPPIGSPGRDWHKKPTLNTPVTPKIPTGGNGGMY